MCAVCGCGTAAIAAKPHAERPAVAMDALAQAHNHSHAHAQDHYHAHADGIIDFGKGIAGVHVPGMSQERTIRIERDILSKNAAFAHSNRMRLRNDCVFALNLVSSPGSGKTSLLIRTITDLKGRWPIAVVEGDQQTSRDAEQDPRHRCPGRADQYRQRLPSRCAHGRPRARSTVSQAGQSAFH